MAKAFRPIVSALQLRKYLIHSALGLAAIGLSRNVSATEAPKLEKALHDNAPKIIQKLLERDCRGVGVLKFRVQKGGGRPTDNAGPFNTFVTDRLEAALVLANPRDETRQLKLIHNASGVAAKIPGASHLNPDGTTKLFSQSYPPAWGKTEVSPDAFLTGVISVAPDYASMRVNVLAVQRDKPLEALLSFDADLDGALLSEMGESYKLRGIPGSPSPGRDSPAEEVVRVRSQAQAHPLRDDPAVALFVDYSGRPVEFRFENGEALIPEPREGQSVSLRIESRGIRNMRLGAVLKVNGENVLHKERKRDIDCMFYRLDKAKGPIVVDGFQIDGKTAERFRVASIPESKSLEMHYGPDVGTISLTVFKEITQPQPVVDYSDEAPDLAAIAAASFPPQPPINPEALKAQMHNFVQKSTTRGVITTGARIRQEIEEVQDKIVLDPEPIMSVVVRYYRPQ
jgi:hypothetical protein